MTSKRRPARKARAEPPADRLGLETLRAEIDALDEQLQALINRRAQLAQRVGISKHAAGHTVDFYRPDREAPGAACGAGT